MLSDISRVMRLALSAAARRPEHAGGSALLRGLPLEGSLD